MSANQQPPPLEAMNMFGQAKLQQCLRILGFEEHIPEIEHVPIDDYQVLYQVLPLRVYVYNLETELGEITFEWMCQNERPPEEVLEVAIVQVGNYTIGYYLYSLKAIKKYSVPETEHELAVAPYALLRDWRRLIAFSQKQDIARAIFWLRKHYSETVHALVTALVEGKSSYELTRSLVYLQDETFEDTLQRLMLAANTEKWPGADILIGRIDVWLSETREHIRLHRKALRRNPLIAALFAINDRRFHAITLKTFATLCDSQFEDLGIALEDIEQCNNFFNYVLDFNPQAAYEIGELTYCASRHLIAEGPSEQEALAYAACNLGSSLVNAGEPERALPYLQQAYAIFKALDPSHHQLETLRLIIRRVSFGLSGDEPVRHRDALSINQKTLTEKYNELAAAGRVDEAVEVMDRLIETFAENNPVRVDLNAQVGSLYVEYNRIKEAYKRLYRCKNLMQEEHLYTEAGYVEVLEICLLYRSGDFSGAAEYAEEARQRIGHVCHPQCLRAIMLNLVTSLCDSGDVQEAIATINKYETALDGEDRVYLWANLAYALVKKGDFEEVLSVCRRALDSFQAGYRLALKFDLLHHVATAKLGLFVDGKIDYEDVFKAFGEAEELISSASSDKKSLFYRSKTMLLETFATRTGNPLQYLEEGFSHIEQAFLDIARLVDDINDKNRLLAGLKMKIDAFQPYKKLFTLYVNQGLLTQLFNFCQRFKAKFLVEAYFSNSETMCAEKTAEHLAKIIEGGDQSGLNKLRLANALIKASGPGSLRRVTIQQLCMEGLLKKGEIVLPISLEHLDLDAVMFLAATENISRGEEINTAMSAQFLEAQLSDDTAVIEFFPLESATIGSIVIQKGSEPQFLGCYTLPTTLLEQPLFSIERVDRLTLEANEKAFQMVFSHLGEDLRRVLTQRVKHLVFCPTLWMWQLPLHAVLFDGHKSIGEIYTCVYCPSATLYALSMARKRKGIRNGIGIVDPRSELIYADQEARILLDCTRIKFNRVGRSTLTEKELRENTKDSHWVHLSAHGYQDERYSGFGSGLETGPQGVKYTDSDENLTALGAFLEHFPGIQTSVVVLSSCYAGEVIEEADEPVGLPTTLLLGGAKAVIAPVWQVDEFSTLIFMELLYEELTSAPTLATAVQKAQKRLSMIETGGVIEKLDRILVTVKKRTESIKAYGKYLREGYRDDECPYGDPFYWAAFRVVGADVVM